MTTPIEFLYDFVSPTTYLAHLRMPSIAERTGAAVTYTPIYLGGVMKATGNAPPMTVPAKGGYLLRDLQRYAEHDGVPFQFNPNFPINTMTLLRIATGLDGDRLVRFNDAIFDAMWAQAKDLGDEAVLRDMIAGAGLDADELMALAADQKNKDTLRANTDRAVERGVFGAPSFLVGDEMFWGQDRTDWVERFASR